jgi:hypothetical protein
MQAWNQCFNNFLTTYGLSPNDVDPCVYFCEEACLLIAIFINVGLVYNPKITQIDDILIHIGKNFTIIKGMFDVRWVSTLLKIKLDIAHNLTKQGTFWKPYKISVTSMSMESQYLHIWMLI